MTRSEVAHLVFKGLQEVADVEVERPVSAMAS
jgi:hypothetical protein